MPRHHILPQPAGPQRRASRGDTGLLVRNYRPKLFAVAALETLAPVVIPRGCRRVLTQRGVHGRGELAVRVQAQR